MKTAHYWGITAVLCGIAIRAGLTLGRHPDFQQAAKPDALPAPSATVTGEAFVSESPVLRRAAARCDTSALWLWMQAHSGKGGEAFQAAAQELLDREGVAAIRHACDLEDPEQRRTISEALLAAYSGKDVWAAYEIYKELRDRFGLRWGDDMVNAVFTAACRISADRLIVCMSECPGGGPPGRLYFSEKTPPFAQGFDFPKLTAYLDALKEPPRFILDDLLGFWAKQHPADAVSWHLANRSRSSYVQGRDGMGLVSGDFDNEFMKSVIESEGSREERVAALRMIPEENRKELWVALLSGEWAAGESGVLDPKFLEVAETTTGRGDFLTTKLLETRGREELAASWSVVPPEEREAVIQECLRRWEKEEPTQLGKRARAQWQAWIEREWR